LEFEMTAIGRLLLGGFFLLAALPASAQVSGTRIDDMLNKGWYFRGNTRADAEARIAGANGTALFVDCNGSAQRVVIVFRNRPSAAGASLTEPTMKKPIELTFRFIKRSLVSGATSYFDSEDVRHLRGEYISAGRTGEAPIREQVNFDGEPVPGIVGQLKSMDSVSVGASTFGQPMTFDLKGAAAVIDRVLGVCASGP
jgi:hypothetical protein